MASTERSARTGAGWAVAALEELGVEVVFGLPGVHNLPLWKALSDSPIRLVGVRHEQAAAYAADGYARASGRLGVAAVTTGPGAANTIGAIGEAWASGSPVLLLATDVPHALRREGIVRGALHEASDQRALFVPVTKLATEVDAASALAIEVCAAARTALQAPSGPVYVGVPTDLLSEAAPGPPSPGLADPVRSGLGMELEDAMESAVELIEGSTRPLVWAGGGALRAEAGGVVRELGLRLAAPVVTTFSGRGLVPPGHPSFVPGPLHEPEVGRLWDEADLVLAVGTDLDGMSTQNWTMPAPRRLIAVNVDREDAAKSYRPDVTLVGDAREVVAELVSRIRPRAGVEELRSSLELLGESVERAIELDEPEAARFLRAMDEALPPEAVVVADMCIPGYWLAGYREVALPRTLAYPMGWGTLGFAFPAALGAALATSAPTVCVCGDGGFLFACGELATLAQEQMPLTVIIVDDGGYGMLRFDQLEAGDRAFGVDLATPDFVSLARSFGIAACETDGFDARFVEALRRCLAEPEPSVLVVKAQLKPPPTTSPRWYRRRQDRATRVREETG
jgi:acetolactate synthase-1/2/3 large subunit